MSAETPTVEFLKYIPAKGIPSPVDASTTRPFTFVACAEASGRKWMVRSVVTDRILNMCLKSNFIAWPEWKESPDPVNLQLLDLVPVAAVADKDRDLENFTACVQKAQSVLRIGSRRGVADLERARCVIVKKGLENLLRLLLAGIIGRGHDRDLKIVVEPDRQSFGVPPSKILGYRHKDIIAVSGGIAVDAGQQHGNRCEYLCKDLHDKGRFFTNSEPLFYRTFFEKLKRLCYFCTRC